MITDFDNKPVVMGLDLSLTQTGWAVLDDDHQTGVLKPKDIRGAARLDWLENQVKELVWHYKPNLAVIENYAFGARNQLAQLGELGGIIRLLLYKNNVRFIEVAPTTLKKFVTGKGVAEKGAMQMYVLEQWGIALGNNNEADAYGLAQFGRCYVDHTGYLVRQSKVVIKFRRDQAGKEGS